MYIRFFFSFAFLLLLTLSGCGEGRSSVVLNPSQPTASLYGLAGATAGMLVADFFLQTTIHEGTHAIAAKRQGFKITVFRPFPGYTPEGHFSFGFFRGERQGRELGNSENGLITIAPKFTDVGMLYSYIIFEEFNLLPENQYAQLAMWVVAFGAWVDFSKDVCAGICYQSPSNDVVNYEKSMGYNSPWEKLAVRGSIVLIAGFASIPLYKGLRKAIDPSLSSEQDDSYGSLSIGPGIIGYKLEF